MRRWVTIMLLLSALGVAAALAGWSWLDRSVRAPGAHERPVRIVIASGSSLREVLQRAAAAGAIGDARRLELWLRLRGRSPSVRTGHYEIPPRASALAVLEQLEAGRVVLEALTVVEGTTFAEFRRALEAHAAVRQSLAGRSDA